RSHGDPQLQLAQVDLFSIVGNENDAVGARSAAQAPLTAQRTAVLQQRGCAPAERDVESTLSILDAGADLCHQHRINRDRLAVAGICGLLPFPIPAVPVRSCIVAETAPGFTVVDAPFTDLLS